MTRDEIYRRIDVLCAPEAEGGLSGWCPVDKARWLVDHILKEHLTNVVEIGVFGGRSLIPMGLAVKALGRGGFVLGVDPYEVEHQIDGVTMADHVAWAGQIDFEKHYQNTLGQIRAEGVGSHCGVLRAASDECVGLIGPLDLLHIDGCHSVLASCRDVETWVPKVRAGGLVVLDDAEWETVRTAREMLRTMCEPPRSFGAGWEAWRKT